MLLRLLPLLVLCIIAAVFAGPWQQTIRIEADDLMRIKPTRISAKSGSKVVLELKNTGRIQSLQHNWVLLAADTDVTGFGNAAMNAKSTGYIPASMKDKVIAHTSLVSAGQSTTVTFTVPAKGTYTYICSFPGHYSAGRGTLTAE
ncbi:MAG: plastocyanin/azurin family copper-binding protein [Acidobacteriota bacterium]|nr:plastocyanin/azurin family copper-binding protein [Acidobacteriota bacterium]